MRHRTQLVWALTILLLAAAVRLALPYAVKSYVNRALNANAHYSGHVEDIELALWRGSYSILGAEIRQNDSAVDEPLFASPKTELSVLWSGLLQGTIVAQIKTYDARLTFAAGGGKGAAQTGRNARWGDLLKKLTPFSIDHLDVIDGQVHYIDRNSQPPVDVFLSKVNGSVDNLTNREVKGGRRVATLHAKALAMDQADLDVDLSIDPYAARPDFALKLRLLGLEAVKMKDFVQAYTLFDPKDGTLDLVVEANAKDGGIDGYVKPLFHHLQLLTFKKAEADLNPVHFLTDAVGSVLNLVFQNQRKQQLATQVPFSGRIDGPQVDLADALVNLLRNALVQAFSPEFEHAQPEKEH